MSAETYGNLLSYEHQLQIPLALMPFEQRCRAGGDDKVPQ